MDKYEKFKKKVEHTTIDEVPGIPCPNCGGGIGFVGMPDETYRLNHTFIRNELLSCDDCGLRVEIEQVYTPTKCYVTEFKEDR